MEKARRPYERYRRIREYYETTRGTIGYVVLDGGYEGTNTNFETRKESTDNTYSRNYRLKFAIESANTEAARIDRFIKKQVMKLIELLPS